MFATADNPSFGSGPPDVKRREFFMLRPAPIGSAIIMWPFIDSMKPLSDVRGVSSTEVDLAPIEIGQRITIK